MAVTGFFHGVETVTVDTGTFTFPSFDFSRPEMVGMAYFLLLGM